MFPHAWLAAGCILRRRALRFVAALLTVLLPICVAQAEELDCHVYDSKAGSITIGFKAGNFLFEVGPEVTFGSARGIAWDKVVQGIIARYKEVCTRYNAGVISKEEYAQRLREIDGLYREALELEKKLRDETHAHARSMHSEMERALAGRSGGTQEISRQNDQLGTALSDLSAKIEQLETAGHH